MNKYQVEVKIEDEVLYKREVLAEDINLIPEGISQDGELRQVLDEAGPAAKVHIKAVVE